MDGGRIVDMGTARRAGGARRAVRALAAMQFDLQQNAPA
jgi:hypothetical protein